ncbi:MAG: hypothetical protein ACXVY3_09575 [Gaiellaceae bacterium]
MQLVRQWGEIERSLPERWAELDLALTLAENAHGPLAAALLEPLSPALTGASVIGLRVRRDEVSLTRRLIARLEQDNIDGLLETGRVTIAEEAVDVQRPTLVETWSELLTSLPQDWSDLLLELRLESSDDLDRAALRLAPANPARSGLGPRLRVRVARLFGYGVSAEMMRRCLERLDEDGIPGSLGLLRAQASTLPVATQGPVWRMAGKTT